MGEKNCSILGELSAIVTAVFISIKDDLLFPGRPKTIVQRIYFEINQWELMIYQQQNQLGSQGSTIRRQGQEIINLKDLIVQKDREISRLEEQIKSYQLFVARQHRRR